MKFAKNENVDFQLQKEVNFHNYKIAPLLLIPFVENAIKHGLGSKGDGYIHLSFHVSNEADLIFLDIDMPNLDGMKLSELIRGRRIPIGESYREDFFKRIHYSGN